MNTKHLREIFNLTQVQISEKFNIPLNTIKNWDSRNCMPSYVYEMMSKILFDYELIDSMNCKISRLESKCNRLSLELNSFKDF